jgi:hypothetical protein
VTMMTTMALGGTEMVMALRGTATVMVTVLKEGWQRWELGLQKPKGFEERRMERTRWIFFREYVGIFEVFFFNFRFL